MTRARTEATPAPETGTLSIPASHPALAGHFPGAPIVPGVVLLDQVLQRIDADARAHAPREAQRADGLASVATDTAATAALWHVSSIKFHRLVLPQQSLTLHYSADAAGRIRFELRLADTLVASGALQRRASGTPDQAGP